MVEIIIFYLVLPEMCYKMYELYTEIGLVCLIFVKDILYRLE